MSTETTLDAPTATSQHAAHTDRSGRSGLRGRRARRAAAAIALAATAATAAIGAGGGSAGALNGVRLYANHSWLNVAVADGSTAPGARLIQWTYTGGSEQLWNVPDRGTTGQIRNVKSGLCVTTDGIKGHWLYQDRCDGRPQQQWESNVINHLYFIPNSVSYRNPSTGFAWDVQGYSLNRGANIVGWSEKGDQFDVLNQLFTEV